MQSDQGSILPIGIAGVALSLAVSLVFLELIGVQLQTLRNKQLSDVLSLKVASDLRKDQISPVIGLEYLPVLRPITAAVSTKLRIRPSKVSVISVDGKTIESTVCSEWESVTGLRLGNFGQVCSSSKARAVS
jgi:hypothetical protein